MRSRNVGAVLLLLSVVAAGLLRAADAHAEAVIGELNPNAEGFRSSTRVFNNCAVAVNGTDAELGASVRACIDRLEATAATDGATRTSGRLYYHVRLPFPVDFRPAQPPPPVDTDSDGVPDSSDRCPTVNASTPDGCPATPLETWTRCAAEGELCAFTGTRRVRYGVDGRWSSSRDIVAINGGVACGNAVFGDPAQYTEKVCELSSVIPTQQEPPPPPVTGTATLTWTNRDAYTGIEVFRATAESGPWMPVATVNPDATRYVVPNLQSGTHWFYVTGSIGSNASAPSNFASKVIP